MRAKDFERCHTQAAASLDASKDSDFNDLYSIKTAIEQTKKLVRTPSEQTKVSELENKYNAMLSTFQSEKDTAFNNELTDVANSFAAIKQDNEQPSKDILLATKKLSSRIELLLQKQNITAGLKERAKKIQSQITKYETNIDEQLKQNEAFNNLVTNIPSWKNYQYALNNFVKKYPSHHAAGDINDILNELVKINKTSTIIYELVETYRKNNDYDLLVQEAPELSRKIKNLADNLTTPVEELFTLEKEIQLLAKIKPFDAKSLKTTEDLLNALSKREVYPWLAGKQWYYLTEKPTKAGNYEYITSFVSDKKNYQIFDNAFNEYKHTINATQQQFSIDALKKTAAIKNNATDIVCNLIEEVISDNYILDPILKCVLIDLLITDMSKIDPFFEIHYAKCQKIIIDSGIDLYANWMDVNSKNTIPQREIAKAVLERLPNIQELKELSEKTKLGNKILKQNLKNTQPKFEWIGLLSKNDEIWNCKIKNITKIAEEGEVYILRLKNAENKLEPIKIGNIIESKIQLDDAETSKWLQCSPVFIKQ
ncbi:MAG: hypothetical protein LBP59_06305 [Planctomycetaceae bacterium]|jgi:hypothetical protein|nr:hypothetical protein [Planctomycetaceae bacterium]